MIKEQIRIVVASNGHRFERIETVETDGSFDAVQAACNRIVNRSFAAGTVMSSFWQYVQDIKAMYEVHIESPATKYQPAKTTVVKFGSWNGATSYACPFVKGGKSTVLIYRDGKKVSYYSHQMP